MRLRATKGQVGTQTRAGTSYAGLNHVSPPEPPAAHPETCEPTRSACPADRPIQAARLDLNWENWV